MNKIKRTKILYIKNIALIRSFLKKKFKNRKSFYILDKNVENIFNISKLLEVKKKILIDGNELSKNINTVIKITSKLSNFFLNKKTVIVAIGGGVISDIAGFVSKIYLRGVELVLIPTTLLAQVDAAIGGKNGVNTLNGKNLLGTINQPSIIIVTYFFIKKLSYDVFISGFAEIIKIAIISSKKLFNFISKNTSKIKKRKSVVKNIIKKAINLKMNIVKKDVNEKKNIRIQLNLGHTFAHAVERFFNYKIPHGTAVYIGIYLATFISKKLSYIKKKNLIKINRLIYKLYPLINNKIKKINFIKLFKIFIYDKKSINKKKINFVLIKKIGKVFTKKYNIKKIYKFF